MSSLLVQLEMIRKIVFNTLLVSIPEEFFLVMLALILVGEFDYWEEAEYKKLINKWDYARVFIPTVVSSLLASTMRYTGHDLIFTALLPLAAMYFLIILTNKEILEDHGSAIWAGKVLLFLLLGYLIIFISEQLYTPIFLYAAGETVTDLNNNILLNFAMSIPAKLIEYLVLVFFVIKKRTLLKANLLLPILENKVSKFLAYTIVICNFGFALVMGREICYERILSSLSMDIKCIIILSTVLFPIINISALVYGFYNIKNRDIQKQKEISGEIVKLLNGLKEYAECEKYDNIKWKLNEMSIDMKKIAESLYKSNTE